MVSSPICTIMGVGGAGKCIYGSVPKMLIMVVPHLYDNRGKEEIQMCQSPNVQMCRCPNVQMYQSAIFGSPLTRSSAEW